MGRSSQTLIDTAFRLIGAGRAFRPRHIRQLALTGVDAETMKPVLKTIRSLNQWTERWTFHGEDHLKSAKACQVPSRRAEHYKSAAAMFYMASIFHLPGNPRRPELTEKMVSAYHAFGRESRMFHPVIFHTGEHRVHGNLYHPAPHEQRPVIIMIPPLGSVKEQIHFQVAPFFNAGIACLTLDLPGVGETQGSMPLDTQWVIGEVITQLLEFRNIEPDTLTMMGLSLGAYWTMKTAAVDERVRMAIGVSTPAVSGKHWERIPAHYWGYFQEVFKTQTLEQTRHLATQLCLYGVMDRITCPVLLIHGKRDKVSQPDAMSLFEEHTRTAPLSTRTYDKCDHCCLDELERQVLPSCLSWYTEHLKHLPRTSPETTTATRSSSPTLRFTPNSARPRGQYRMSP
jgi:pimeloyl-ACP methyl ester carboxylesterase